MLVQFVLADSVLIATEKTEIRNPEPKSVDDLYVKDGKHWDVFLTDRFSGKSHNCRWSTSELSAVMALAVGYGEEEDADPEVTKKLYEKCEPLFAAIPEEVRSQVRCIP